MKDRFPPDCTPSTPNQVHAFLFEIRFSLVHVVFQAAYGGLNNALGCVYEKTIDFLRGREILAEKEKMSVIVYNAEAKMIAEREPLGVLKEHRFAEYKPKGNTSFVSVRSEFVSSIHWFG